MDNAKGTIPIPGGKNSIWHTKQNLVALELVLKAEEERLLDDGSVKVTTTFTTTQDKHPNLRKDVKVWS